MLTLLEYSVCFYVKSKLLYHNKKNPVLTTGVLNTKETNKCTSLFPTWFYLNVIMFLFVPLKRT